jgi:hypothetical protein
MKAFENLFPRNILLDLYPWKNTELKRLGSIPAKYTREIKPRRKIPPKKITQKYTTKMKSASYLVNYRVDSYTENVLLLLSGSF